MKRLLFPYTAIDPELAAALAAGLGPLTLIRPLCEAVDDPYRTLAASGQIELVYPFTDDAAPLTDALEAFRVWAAEHAGQDLVGLLGQGATIPFFDADATVRIAAEIKSGQPAPGDADAAEWLSRARLLLLLAEELDARSRELAADFERLAAQERRMFEALKGDADDAAALDATAARPLPVPDTAIYLPAVRLQAWAQVARQAEDFRRDRQRVLFLTPSVEIFDLVVEKEDAVPLLERYPLSTGAGPLMRWLDDPGDTPPPDASGFAGPHGLTISLIRLPGTSPRDWLQRLSGDRSAGPLPRTGAAQVSGMDVLVGHVTPG
jgi:hypothetical protein